MVRRHFIFFALSVILSVPRLVCDGASWQGPLYTLTVPTHIDATTRTVSDHLNITLARAAACDVYIHVHANGDEVLTGPSNTKLTTKYMLTGGTLAVPDADWVDSTTFRSNVYHVNYDGLPTTILTLSVQGSATAGQNPPAGNYTSTIYMTVTW
ncbi:MAG: hypothetical protein WCI73_06135 [Phycisphaerae bacterium]